MASKMKEIRLSIIMWMLRILGKGRMKTRDMCHPKRKLQLQNMRKFFRKFNLEEAEISGHFILTISPRKVLNNYHIIYLHGGAYVWQGEFVHWHFLRKLIDEPGCRATYVEYPLAPEHRHPDAINMLQGAYDHLIKKHPGDRFILMGDSAGGGLAMAFAQKLQADQHPNRPEKIILVSPWLDLKLDNPDIAKIEPLDPMLNAGALRFAADLYAGGGDLSDELLSPIHGCKKGLGEISIFIGARDILWPDCRKFYEACQAEGVQIQLFEYPDMPHVWMLFPIAEARDALKKIVSLIR